MPSAFTPTTASVHTAARTSRNLLSPLLVATALAWGLPAVAADASTTEGTAAPTSSYEPKVGQAGKDVVWVPTPQALVDAMLDIAKATPKDYLIDLGSGDGRTVITAAKRGLTAHGIEYNPDMVELARRNAKEAGVSERATFAAADLFESDFSKADVITMFLLPSINEKLSPTLLDLKPGTRLVSNSFRMGAWEPDDSVTISEGCTSWCTAHLWIVPAKVAGSWQLGDQELKLEQDYQMLSGTLGTAQISDAKLLGNAISFSAGGATYQGSVNGAAMSGELKGGAGGSWHAVRK